eukprot:373486-Amphidinium_carterae.1
MPPKIAKRPAARKPAARGEAVLNSFPVEGVAGIPAEGRSQGEIPGLADLAERILEQDDGGRPSDLPGVAGLPPQPSVPAVVPEWPDH